MSCDIENFSFARKLHPLDRKIPFSGRETRFSNEKEALKNTDALFRPHLQNRRVILRQMLNNFSNAPIKQPLFIRKHHLKTDVSSHLQDSLQLSGQRISSVQESEKDSRVIIRNAEETFKQPIGRSNQKNFRASEKVEVPRLSLIGQKYLRSSANCDSPMREPLSAREHNHSSRIYTNIPDDEQIEKFKDLLRKHPEPVMVPQYHRIQRRFRPKSHEPVTALLSSRNGYSNPEGFSKMEDSFSETSFDRSPRSGFLSERKSTSPRPDYNEVLPTKPILVNRRREFSPNHQRNSPLVPPLKFTNELMVNSIGNYQKRGVLSDRPRTYENDSSLANMAFHDTHLNAFAKEPPQSSEKKIFIRRVPARTTNVNILTETSENVTRNGRYHVENARVSQINDISEIHFQTEVNEGLENSSFHSQRNRTRASEQMGDDDNSNNRLIKNKAVQRLKLRGSFGNLQSSEKDLLKSTTSTQPVGMKETAHFHEATGNGELLRTPKFQSGGNDGFESLAKLPESALSKQLVSQEMVGRQEADLYYRPITSASQWKHSKLKITRLQTTNRLSGEPIFN